jgi:hypothetical protein
VLVAWTLFGFALLALAALRPTRRPRIN